MVLKILLNAQLDTTSTSLDFIASSCEKNLILKVGAISVKPVSDHHLVYCVLDLHSRPEKLDLLKRAVEKLPLHLADLFESPEDQWYMIKKMITDCLNEIAPLKEMGVRKDNKPWFDTELHRLALTRDRLHQKAMKSPGKNYLLNMRSLKWLILKSFTMVKWLAIIKRSPKKRTGVSIKR